MFDLEIELRDDSEIEMLYMARGQDSQIAKIRREDRNERLSGEEALELEYELGDGTDRIIELEVDNDRGDDDDD